MCMHQILFKKQDIQIPKFIQFTSGVWRKHCAPCTLLKLSLFFSAPCFLPEVTVSCPNTAYVTTLSVCRHGSVKVWLMRRTWLLALLQPPWVLPSLWSTLFSNLWYSFLLLLLSSPHLVAITSLSLLFIIIFMLLIRFKKPYEDRRVRDLILSFCFAGDGKLCTVGVHQRVEKKEFVLSFFVVNYQNGWYSVQTID